MLIHFYQGDDLPNATASFVDEDGGWWVGIQKAGAQLALATALLLSAAQATVATQVFSFHQDDPAGNLTATVDEYFGFNPTFQTQTSLPLVITDDQLVVPQPVAFQPDEDFWQNLVAPIPGYTPPLVITDTDEPAGNLTATVDEYFGFSPTLQIQTTPPLVISDDQLIVPQPLPFHLDEDFWQNPVPPIPGYVPPVVITDTDDPAGNLVVPVVVQNYIATGAENFVTQKIGEGIRF